eukprot:SAG25_NODE_6545_length_551_cov_60.438053_1_plen_32_part_10
MVKSKITRMIIKLPLPEQLVRHHTRAPPQLVS